MNIYPVWDALVPPSQHGTIHRRTVGAKGHRITFADGTSVLDATSGLWNANLGYGNAVITAAVAAALTDASYLTLFRYGHEHAARAARALLDAAGPAHFDRVVFSTSGGAANDAAMKLARHYAHLSGEPDRRYIVGLRGSYHGQTFGGFSLTGEDLGQQMYGVDARLIQHVHHDDPAELVSLLHRCGREVAAIVIEPVLGSGAIAVPDEMISTLLAMRQEYGYLVVADEVATGFGRTGAMFASQAWPEPPDILLTSKGLTNGTCAAAALLVAPQVSGAFEKADATFVHGETQAGTPASCAAIVATLAEMRRLEALETGRRNGALLAAGLESIRAGNDLVKEITGTGCFLGVHLRAGSGAPFWATHITRIVDAIRARGVLVHPGPSSVQIVPPLTMTPAEIDEVVTAVGAGLGDFAAMRRTKTVRRASAPVATT
jgi:adenosylmethionine-8-amino-7-oxononanoate aminotransferase